MPSSKKRTNLSRNSGAMVPSSVVSSRPTSIAASTKIKKKSTKNKAPSSKRRSEETRPLEPDIEEDNDNMSDVSEDPVDNYNLSGDEIDDEPRFKYSTAELPDSSSRNTKCCLLAMCVLCIIVAIAVSIIMVKVPQNKEEQEAAANPSPTPPPPTANGTGLFEERQEAINSKCDDSLLSCKEACTEFDCCDPFMNEQAGCFFGNRQGCLDYQRCHVANPGIIDPPSPNINVICSQSAVADDPGPCEDACLAVKCCWEETSSCKDSNFYACADYAICQNLRGAELEVPLPIEGLADFCDDYVVGSLSQSEACGVACAPANCCWDETTANCLQDNFFTCLLHEPCGTLEISEAFSFVPEPDSDPGIVCSKPYRDTQGSAQCEATCNRAPCCSAASGENCFWRDPLGCLKYDGCKLLLNE